MKSNLISFSLLGVALSASAQESSLSYMPPGGYVPDAETAIRIAVAVWEPIYGAKQIQSEKPFRARLLGDAWIVEGSLPDGSLGGVALAEISKRDGTVRRVIHGQ